MTDTTTPIALNKLLPWAGNVRKTDADKDVARLAASIAAHGLLQSLVVRKDKGGKYAVVAGRRRLLALKSLAESGTIDANRPIPCTIVTSGTDPSEISLAENVQREPMHPADEFDAFKALAENGMPVTDVAARFGVTEAVVKQRLKLARVSPSLIAAYRNGEMTLQHVMAFTVTDDHAVQERVWAELAPWQKDDPQILRDQLTAEEITAEDRRVAFVSLEAYEAAGGSVRRDLFSKGDDGVFIDDVALLNGLVAAKLEETARTIRTEGWKWVEIRVRFDHDEWSAFSRRFPEPTPLSQELQEEADTLQAEVDALIEIDDPDDEQQTRIEALNARLDELNDAPEFWPAETLAVAGAVVTLDPRGNADVRRGYVKPEDAPAGPRRRRAAKTSNTGQSSVPASLIENLTSEQSAALSATLLGCPDLALATIVHALALPIFYGGACDSTALQIRARTSSLRRVEGSRAAQLIAEAETGWAERIPCNPDDLFGWCLSQPSSTLGELLAFCAARTANAVIGKADHPGSPRVAHASLLAEALKLDMKMWFTPTADNYFALISKSAIIDALRDGLGATAPAWDSMKKADLALLAERKLSGTGWLPEILRPRTGNPVCAT